MNEDRLFSVEEVAVLIKSSVPTISSWYRWKRLHPEHEMAKMLPDFERHGPHRARYWHYADIWKLVEFKQALPQGRKGIMGDVTQCYIKNSKWNKKSNGGK